MNHSLAGGARVITTLGVIAALAASCQAAAAPPTAPATTTPPATASASASAVAPSSTPTPSAAQPSATLPATNAATTSPTASAAPSPSAEVNVLVPAGSGYPVLAASSLWVPRWSMGDVVRVDIETGRTLATIPVGHAGSDDDGRSGPAAMAGDDRHVWVGVEDDDGRGIVEIDQSTNEVSRRIAMPSMPTTLAVHDGTLWAPLFELNLVTRIDLTLGTVARQIPVEAPVGAVAADDGVWVASGGIGYVNRIDPATNEVQPIRTNMDTEVVPVLTEDEVWVTGLYSGQVAVLSRDTNEVLDHIDLQYPFGITRSGGLMWVSDGGTETSPDRVVALDIAKREIVGIIPVGEAGVDRGIVTDGKRIWVAGPSGVIELDIPPDLQNR